jgi:hypothetical protein
VPPLPSHRVHRIIGERICGYSNPVIDELIDGYIGIEELDETVESSRTLHLDLFGESHQEEKHDAARTSCSDLFKQVEAIYSRFGDKGLCYYVLHHYLDKFINILRGQILHTLGLSLSSDPEWIRSEFLPRLEYYVGEGYEMEVSVFTVLEAIVEGNVKSLEDLIKYILRFDRYDRSTRHRKRRLFREIWSDCMNSLSPERMQLAKLIVLKSREVRRNVVQYAKWIICTLMRYEPEKLAKITPRLLDVLRKFCTLSSNGLNYT